MKNYLSEVSFDSMKQLLRKMRITCVLLIVFASSLFATNVKSQVAKVDIALEDASIIQVIKVIEDQTDYLFVFDKNEIDLSRQVDIDVEKRPVAEVLSNMFSNTDVVYAMEGTNIMLMQKEGELLQLEQQQEQSVSGMVTDALGDVLPGVTIVIKGTTQGIITDFDGMYTMNNVPDDAVMVFSFVGMKTQEIAVAGKIKIDVSLEEESIGLDEVIAVGYGTQKKSVVTGSISVVKSDDVSNSKITRVDDALQGLTSGVTVAASSGAPGASPTIRIRGTTSINNSDPLYIVDGSVINDGIDYLNPNDIESIQVLKDAASASIYGSRASNGVIIVTTKKGKEGVLQINYNMKAGFQGPIRKVDLANATEYAQLRNQSLINDGGTALFADPTSYGEGTNWQDEIFSNNAKYQDHSLSISGGSDKATYFTSLGYIDQQGIVAPSIAYNKKYSLTTNTSFKIGKYVTVGENLSYTYGKSQTGLNTNSEFGGPLSSALNLDPITSVYADDETASGYSDYAVMNGDKYYGISDYVSQEITNPLAHIATQKGNYNWSHNLVGNAYIEIAPIEDLKFRSSISAKKSFWGSESYTPLYYLNASTSNTSNTSHYRQSDQNLIWNWDNTISYTKNINDHDFTLMVGTSSQKQTAQGINVTYVGEPALNADAASFNYSLSAANRIGSGYEDQDYSLYSYFSRLTYNYKEKYLFTGIIRRDGSSKFGSNNRYGIFPSASVGWVVTREDFFPDDSFVDNLKFRASYGVVGNEMSLGSFAYESLVSGGRNYVLGNDDLTIGYATTRPANPDLMWEETHSIDIGFDALLFKSVNVTFDAYKKTTEGMLQEVQLPDYAGYTNAPYGNVGDMENRGLELEASYKRVVGDYTFGVSGNISYLENEVTYLGSGKEYLDGGSTLQSSNYALTRTAVGHAIGSFYGFKELGVFHSQDEIDSYAYSDGTLIQPNALPGDLKWQDTTGDGGITSDDRTWIGDPTPNWTYGITFNMAWKNWDFLVFGQGVWGNEIFQGYRRLDIPAANYSVAALDAWTPTNSNSNYPRLTDSDPNNNYTNPSDFYIQSGAYFRIKNLQVGYTLPKVWINSIGLKKVRMYVSSSNLITLTKYDGYDPEVGGTSYGIDRGIYPQARTFMFGLNVGL